VLQTVGLTAIVRGFKVPVAAAASARRT